jgi:chromosome segregation ATPase
MPSTSLAFLSTINQSNVFESLLGDYQNPLADRDDDDDDESIIEKRSIRPLVNRSSASANPLGRPGNNIKPIMSPLMAVLKAIEHLALSQDVLKDTVLIQRVVDRNCIFDLLSVKPDPLTGSKTVETVAKLTTPSERMRFDPIEITRERIDTFSNSKYVDQLKVTPEGDVTKISSKVVQQTKDTGASSLKDKIGVEDVVANLSNYVKMMKKEPFYLKIVADTPVKLSVETFEILDKFEEILRERIDIQKDSSIQKQDNIIFNILRTAITSEGQVMENLEYQKDLKAGQVTSPTSAKIGRSTLKIIGSKSVSDSPTKPYRNSIREKVQADILGVTPSSTSKPFDIDQIIEEIAKSIEGQPYLVRQSIEGDSKIVAKYKVNEDGRPLELVETYTISLKDIPDFKLGAPIAGSPSSQPHLEMLSEFLIKPYKQPDGSTIVKVFKVVKEEDQSKPNSKLSLPFREEEKKKWKIIFSEFKDQSDQPETPVGLLEIEEVTVSPTKQIVDIVKPLGEIVAITEEGKPVYEKQIAAQDDSSSEPSKIGPAQPFRVESHGARGSIGMNMFGSMIETDPGVDARRSSVATLGHHGRKSRLSITVHPSPAQATPRELANFYKGMLGLASVNPEDKNKIIEELLGKLENSIAYSEANSLKKELDAKDRLISEMASSNVTADFGDALKIKDDELRQLRQERSVLQENIDKMMAKIAQLQSQVPVPAEIMNVVDRMDKSFDEELAKIAQDLYIKSITDKPASAELTKDNLTVSNKENLKQVVLGTWKLIDDLEKRSKAPSQRESVFKSEPIIDKLREENADIRLELDRAINLNKELNDKIQAIETRSLIGTGKRLLERSPSQIQAELVIDPFMSKSITTLLDELADRDITRTDYQANQEPLIVDRGLLKAVLVAGDEIMTKFRKIEGKVKDLQADLRAANNRISFISQNENVTDPAKQAASLSEEVAAANKQINRLTQMNISLQKDNDRLRDEQKKAEIEAEKKVTQMKKQVDADRKELDDVKSDVKALRSLVDQKDAQIMGLTSAGKPRDNSDPEKNHLRELLDRSKADIGKLENELAKGEQKVRDLQEKVRYANDKINAVEDSRRAEVSNLQEIIDNLREQQGLKESGDKPVNIPPSSVSVNHELRDLQSRLNDSLKELELKDRLMDEQLEDIDRLRTELKNYKDALAVKEVELLSLMNAGKPRDGSDPEKNLLRDQVARARSEISKLEDELRRCEQKMLDQQSRTFHAEERAKTVEQSRVSEVANMQKIIDELRKEKGGPRFGQPVIDPKVVQEESNQLQRARDDLQSMGRTVRSLESNLFEEKDENKRLRDEIKRLKDLSIESEKKIIELSSAGAGSRKEGKDGSELQNALDSLARANRLISVLEEEQRKKDLMIVDLQGKANHSEQRLQDVEKSKKSELMAMEKALEFMRMELASKSGQTGAPTVDYMKEINRLNDDLNAITKSKKEVENKLRTAEGHLGDADRENKTLKDRLAMQELKILEATSPKITSLQGSEQRSETADPAYDSLIGRSLSNIAQMGITPAETHRDQIVPVSSAKLNQINQAIPQLMNLVKDREESLKEKEHNNQILKQKIDALTSELSKSKEQAKVKIESLIQDLESASNNYRQTLDKMHDLQRQSAHKSPSRQASREFGTQPQGEEEKLREQIKILRDKVSNLETENSILKNTDAISSPVKIQPQRPEILEKVDEDLDQAIKNAQKQGLEVNLPRTGRDVAAEEWRIKTVLSLLKASLSDTFNKADKLDAAQKDIKAAEGRIENLQKSLNKAAEEYRSKLEDKDNEIKKYTKEADSMREVIKRLQPTGESAEREKQLQNELGQKGTEISKLKSTVESLRDSLQEAKNLNNDLGLDTMKQKQEIEILKAQITKLSSNKPEELTGDIKNDLASVISSLSDSRMIGNPGVSTMEYKVPASILASLLSGAKSLMEAVNQAKVRESKLKEELRQPVQDLSSEVKSLQSQLAYEKDHREQDRRDREKSENDWKRREAELMKNLEQSVSIDAMNEKMTRLKGELEEKKNLINTLQKESKNLQSEIKDKESEVGNLDKALSEKSVKLIEMDSLKTKLTESEEARRKLEEKFRQDKEAIEEESKQHRSECQRLKVNLEGASSRIKELEKQVNQLQQEQASKKKEPVSDNMTDAIRSQATLIATLRDKESKANMEIQRLTREKENLQKALENAQIEIDQRAKQDSDVQKQITEMYDQIDKINEELTAKQVEVIEAYKEVDSWKDKARRQSLQGSSISEEDELRKRIATVEAENQRRRMSEAELIQKVSNLNNDIKQERNRRVNTESELEARRRELAAVNSDLNSLQSKNKQLSERNLELNQKLLTLKSDTAVDEKFSNLEDEMNKLKNHNESLTMKLKELNDDLKSNNIRERSLSRENSDLKNKLKNEELAKIKRSNSSAGSPKRDIEPPVLPPRPERLSEGKIQQQLVDYGPVHDLKMKNINLQQEITMLRNKLKEMEMRDQRDASMINFLKTTELKSKDMSPIRATDTFKPGETLREGLIHESLLEPMMDITMRETPLKASVSKSIFAGHATPELEIRDDEFAKLRDEVHRVNHENSQLKNHIATLKSELINVVHHNVPPELQSPISIPS